MAFVLCLLLLLPAIAPRQDAPAGPSPQLTREEQEQFLLDARITNTEMEPRLPWRITLYDGKRRHDAALETASSTVPGRRDYRHNIAAYQLDRLLDLGLVVPSVERVVAGRRVALTWWVDDMLMDELTRRRKQLQPPDTAGWNDQVQAVRIFDELIANGYRTMDPADYLSTAWDNLLITKRWRVWLVDHTVAFGAARQLANPETLLRCDRKLLANLRALNREALAKRLGAYLSTEQLDALEARRQVLVKHFDQRIAAEGEHAVLYDLPRH